MESISVVTAVAPSVLDKCTGVNIALPLYCFCPFIPNHTSDAPPTLAAGIPITDPRYFSQMSSQELAHVLRSDNQTPMPMLQERHQVLTS